MYKIIILPHFHKQLKHYAKKHHHLKEEIISILEKFNKQQAVNLGNNVYKVRLKTKSIPKGKSKSFRLIILAVEIKKFIAPIVLYFKGDRQDISKKEINSHLEVIFSELRL